MTDEITLEKTFEKLSKLPPIEDLSEEDKKFYSELGKALARNELEHLIAEKIGFWEY